MSTINESLRKLEERGALGQTALPHGVVATPAKTSAAPTSRRQTALVIALAVTAAGLGWSEWQRWHLATTAAAATAPAPVQVQLPISGSAPVPMPAPGPGQTPVQAAVLVPPKPLVQEQAGQKPVQLAFAKDIAPAAVGQIKQPQLTPASARQATIPAMGQQAEVVAAAGTSAVAPKAGEPIATDVAPITSLESKPQAGPVAARKALPVNAKQVSPEQKADAQYLRGIQLLQESRGSDARLALEDALELNPAHHSARQLLAALRVEDRQLGRAETLLTDGLAYHPPASALVALARLKVERGEDVAAIKLLGDNLETGANDGDYQALMGALLMRQGRHEQAAAHYRSAIERQPAQGSWWAGLGLALVNQKERRAEAIHALKQARQSGKLSTALADRVDAQLLTLLRSEDQQ